MTTPAHGATRREPLPGLSLVALLLVALSLRPQMAAIGPLADSIIEDLGVTHAFVGLLTAVPVLCMGVFALFGPSLARLTGARSGVGLSVAVLVLFALLRTIVPGAIPLLLLTFGVGVGTGIIGPILAMFVRGRMPDHMVAGTAAYAAGTILGAAVGSAIAVPLEALTGSWQGALLVISILSALTIVAWFRMARAMPGAPRTRGWLEMPAIPWRRPVAWAVGILFGFQSWLYYGTTAWLPNVYVERGWEPALAAGLLSVTSIASVVAILGVPWLSHRGASRRTLLVAATCGSGLGLLGITVLPGPPLLWTVLVGLGLGATFTLLLTLPTDIGDDAREVGGAATMMLLVGYLVASVAPFALGAVRDITGDFVASLWALVAVAAMMIPLASSLAPHRLRPPVRVAVDPA